MGDHQLQGAAIAMEGDGEGNGYVPDEYDDGVGMVLAVIPRAGVGVEEETAISVVVHVSYNAIGEGKPANLYFNRAIHYPPPRLITAAVLPSVEQPRTAFPVNGRRYVRFP
ncbi:hypothetical protein L6452_34156 [Arctium lappa]|uniref:Uncharacterized protein n=1 Tax=Arctium lappa TaxID=4217 RepID=A0ACB8YI40_ARCLA|nr:hypothetical protein L6452_34156 [Arctium lappa]